MKKILLFAAALVVLTGCKTIEYVPVVEHEVHHDSIYLTKVERDSIYMHDSTYVHDKGDTVLIEKWHTRYVDKIRVDTVVRIKIDSIPKPYPVIKEVEKKLTKTQKGFMILGYLTLLVGIIIAAFKIKKFLP